MPSSAPCSIHSPPTSHVTLRPPSRREMDLTASAGATRTSSSSSSTSTCWRCARTGSWRNQAASTCWTAVFASSSGMQPDSLRRRERHSLSWHPRGRAECMRPEKSMPLQQLVRCQADASMERSPARSPPCPCERWHRHRPGLRSTRGVVEGAPSRPSRPVGLSEPSGCRWRPWTAQLDCG